MSLILEIDFLTGVCRAARRPGDDEPDWPPQPDRVFSALVSAWGVRGEVPEERVALEWLEKQMPPEILASKHTIRTTPDVYVPPNDFETPRKDLEELAWYREDLKHGKRPEGDSRERAWKKALSTLPEYRTGRQPRRFPVAWLDDPTMELIWKDAVPEAKVLDALNALAQCVGYIGHSASLVRCRFLAAAARQSEQKLMPSRRWVYSGRLRELEAAYHARPERPMISSGWSVPSQNNLSESGPPNTWLVLEAIKGEVPDIRASSLVCRLLRAALMCGYRRSGQRDTIPEVVSGHTPDGMPTRNPHLAIVPMAFAGWPHADGHVLGFALIPPHGESLQCIDGFRTAWETVAHYEPDEQQRVLTLRGLPLRGPLHLSPVTEESKRSLSSGPYLKTSSRWATVTPIVLERYLKKKHDAEIQELVADSCKHAGLPRPNPEGIWISKHSAVEGVPSARPLAGEPPWTQWRLPKPLRTRQLTHAIIDFEEQVPGPVLLGAGRFTGLGLCRRMGS